MQAACPHCGKTYNVPDTALGKQARCGNAACKQVFVVGGGAAAAPAPARKAEPTVRPAAPMAGAMPAAAVPQAAYAPQAPAGGSALDDLLAAEMGGMPAAPGAPMMPGQPLPAVPAPGFPTGPLGAAPAYRRKKNLKLPLLIGGGVVGAIAIIALIVMLVLSIGGGGNPLASSGGPVASNGLPEWAAFAASSNTQGVGYFNMEKFVRGQTFALFKRVASNLPGNRGAVFMAGESDLALIKDACFILESSGSMVAVLRTTEDLAPDALASRLNKRGAVDAAPQTHAGTTFYRQGPDYIAKVGPNTYCMSDNELAFRAALDRLQKKEAAPLSPALQAAMQSVSGDHSLAIVRTGNAAPLPGPLAAMGNVSSFAIGGRLDSTISFDAVLTLASEAEARQMKDAWDKMNREMNSGPQPPPQAQAMVEKMKALVRGVSLSQSGSTVKIRGSWSVSQIEDLVNSMQSAGRMGLPF